MSTPAGILRIQASPQQVAFWNSDAKFRCFCGGVGAGKTYAGAVETIKQRPGSKGIVVAPTLQVLRDGVIATFLERFALFIRLHNKGLNIIVLINGTEVHFRSGDEPRYLKGSNTD